MRRVKKAVIPAAGLGTRFLPATKAQPKEMLPVVDTPIIQYVVQEAVDSGIEDILIITGRGKRAIEDHFDRALELEAFLQNAQKESLLDTVRELADLAHIHFIRQKQPLGLGHAVLQAKHHVGDEPFAVLLGDEIFQSTPPCLKQLMDRFEQLQSTIIATREVPLEETQKYGIASGESLEEGFFRVTDLVEKPEPSLAPSRYAVIGRYIIAPGIFQLLEDLGPGVGGEIQLTDALRIMAKNSRVYATAITGKRFDVGDKLGFLQATVEFALARADLGPVFARYLKNLPLA